jgi:Glycosyl transferase family 2
MPVRNGMPYLTTTLESIANQTYRNYKILVRNDGSTDGTLEELERWIPSRIPGQIFSDGSAWGVGRSLAFLVEQADTEFCARIDGDDINRADRLEKQVEFMLQHPQVGVVGSRVTCIDENGTPLKDYDHDTEDADIRWLMRYGCRICHPSAMLRRSAVLAAGNYHPVKYEDSDLWIRMIRVGEMANLPERLLFYRSYPGSLTGAIRDWLPVLRQTAVLHASSLFPGVSDPERGLDLWEATVPTQLTWRPEITHPARFRHLGEFKRSAVLQAREVGKPDDYFTSTQIFQEQYWILRRRFLKRIGLGPLLRLRDRAAGLRKFVWRNTATA